MDHVVIASPATDTGAAPLIQSRAPASPQGVTMALLRTLSFIQRLPAGALLACFWVYQKTLSPVLPVVLGPTCGCRFAPTCSHYAVEAVKTHGAWCGAGLTIVRLLKCSPLHPGGFDPVPAPKPRFSCIALAKATPAAGR